jgi:hypothetical protein
VADCSYNGSFTNSFQGPERQRRETIPKALAAETNDRVEFLTSGQVFNGLGAGLEIRRPPSLPVPSGHLLGQKAVGKPVVQYRLPEPDAKTPRQVTITPVPSPAQPSQPQTELQQQIANARADHSELTVPARLARPHPVIAQWLSPQQDGFASD